MKLIRTVVPALWLLLLSSLPALAQTWTAKLDKDVRFYQPTDLGVLLVGTEKSLYAIDSANGETIWRRKDVALEETDVAPIPGTDLVLLSLEKGDKARVEAIDLLTGDAIWRSEKLKGAVMQMSIDPTTMMLAVVLAKDPKGRAREGFKRRPQVHVLELATGEELWKNEIGEVEMMPTRWPEDSGKEVDYTFDNYYPPAFFDGRLFVFYEGVTSFEARNGKERLREKYRVNEDGFALTEAEPIFTDNFIYVSGHGRIRAISRQTGDTEWEAKDLGLTPEMVRVAETLYVRTGGQFTRLKDGETVERGSYGVSAIDARTGKVIWRYKGADKGITNLLLPAQNTIVIADRDDLIFLDPANGKRLNRVSHKIGRASFGVLNESGNIVIGGQSEIAAFDHNGRQLWRARHTPPGRGVLRTIAAISARAASLYFRFGSPAFTMVRAGQVFRAMASLRWSGLGARSSISNLQALATASAQTYPNFSFMQFGIAATGRGGSIKRNRTSGIEERLWDRLDPSRHLDRLSRYLWHRQQLAILRGQWMYFYTDLDTRDGNGLAGVNINNGRTDREIRLSDLDERFVPDEALGLMFTASGNRIISHRLNR